MTAGPLAGRRIVVTRPADQSAEIVDRLVLLGAEPVLAPLIEVVDPIGGTGELDAALDRLGDYDWLVVTSVNGAARVAHALVTAGPQRPYVAAIGRATAAALPGGADLVPTRQVAEGLVQVFPDGQGRVLIAQAEAARATVADGIAVRGWSVDCVTAYRTVAVRPTPDVMAACRASDAVLLFSGSAARAWAGFDAQAAGRAGDRAGRGPLVVAIGPTTADVAAGSGLKVDAVATDHSLDGLVASLLTVFGRDHYS